jgi:hypothetical protein
MENYKTAQRPRGAEFPNRNSNQASRLSRRHPHKRGARDGLAWPNVKPRGRSLRWMKDFTASKEDTPSTAADMAEDRMILDEPDNAAHSSRLRTSYSASWSCSRAPRPTPEPEEMDHDGHSSSLHPTLVLRNADTYEDFAHFAERLEDIESAMRFQGSKVSGKRARRGRAAPDDRGRITKPRRQQRKHGHSATNVSSRRDRQESSDEEGLYDALSDKGSWSEEESLSQDFGGGHKDLWSVITA